VSIRNVIIWILWILGAFNCQNNLRHIIIERCSLIVKLCNRKTYSIIGRLQGEIQFMSLRVELMHLSFRLTALHYYVLEEAHGLHHAMVSSYMLRRL
jgi:hypothetical protein